MDIFIKIESWLKYRRYLFLLIFLAIFFLVFVYMYFLNAAVFQMAERSKNLEKISELKRELQGMETHYISVMNKLDLEYARSLGFVKAEPTAFIQRQKFVAQTGHYGQAL